MSADGVAAFRRPVAPCPACGESQHIEPLRRVGPVWFLRCLSCQFGLRMLASAVAGLPERRDRGDRRAAGRGGYRLGDAGLTHPCHYCHTDIYIAWVVTPEATWLRCEECGRVERFAASATRRLETAVDRVQSGIWR
jgi:hypothetical protein